MDSYRRPNYMDDDPYDRPRTGTRSPPPRRDYGSNRSRSPELSRRSAVRSPSPYGAYDRYRSSSPYSSRPVDKDPYDRSTSRTRDYDRYDREYERPDSYADDDRTPRDASRYPPPDDRYRSAADRYAPDHDPYRSNPDHGTRRRGASAAHATAGPIPDPLDSPALLAFKQFAQVHRQRQARLDPYASSSSLSTQEMFNLYKRYKLVYTARSARKFWEDKKNVPFFIEKYGMGEHEVARRTERRRAGRQGRKKSWLQELRSGDIDGINFQMQFASSKRSGGQRPDDDSQQNTIFSRSGEPIKITSDSLPIDPCPNQLLIMRIPPSLARRDIETELHNCPGFQYLAVGEAHANKHYFAIAWAVFDTPENTSEAKSKMLDNNVVLDHSLQLDVASRGAQVKFRTAPSGSGKIRRLAKDYKQTRDAIKFFEREDREVLWPEGYDSGLDEADREALEVSATAEISQRVIGTLDLRPVCATDEDEDEVLMQIAESTRVFSSYDEEEDVRRTIEKSLDFHLDLLRQVYHCDYYSSTVCDFAEELERRARAHFRRWYPNGETEAEREGRDTGEEGQSMGEEQWAENLDRKHALLIGGPNANVDIEEQGGVDLEKLCLELAIPFTRQDDSEKHRCIVEVPNTSVDIEGATKPCDKLFRALNFVQKHVCNKHKDLIERELGSRKADIAYLNNYIRDPTRVMPPLTGSLSGGERGGRANGHHASQQSMSVPAFGPDASSASFGGVLRLGASSFVPADGFDGGENGGGGRGGRRRGGGGRRRSPSPGRTNGGGAGLGDRLGGMNPANNPLPIHLGSLLGGGSGANGTTTSSPALHLRLGSQTSNPYGLPSPPLGGGGGGGKRGGRGGGPGGGTTMSSLDEGVGSVMSTNNEPLPPPPRPLDPRAARGQQRSYQDLDTGGADGKGDVMDLEY